MVLIVPVEQRAAVAPRVLHRTETIRKAGPILQGLELSLRVRLSRRGIGSRICLRYAQVREQKGGPLGSHRTTAIRMNHQLPRFDALLVDRLRNQRLCYAGRVPMLHRPADHVSAEHVQDHIEIEVRPLRRTQQLGDVQLQSWFGRSASSSGLAYGGCTSLIAALAHFTICRRYVVYRAWGAKIADRATHSRTARCAALRAPLYAPGPRERAEMAAVASSRAAWADVANDRSWRVPLPSHDTPIAFRSPVPVPRLRLRCYAAALVRLRVPGLEQLAQQRGDVSLDLDHLADRRPVLLERGSLRIRDGLLSEGIRSRRG